MHFEKSTLTTLADRQLLFVYVAVSECKLLRMA